MREIRFGRWLTAFAFGLLVFSTFAVGIDAQTHRRRTTAKKPAPAATPTPTLQPTDAQIVRTADENDPPSNFMLPGQTQKPEAQPADPNVQKVKELTARVKKLESSKNDPYEEKQKRLLLNLDILTRAEQRSETLRKQLFDMIEKENTIKNRLDQIEYDIRPEMISRSATFAGSMRPEEIREMRKKSLDSEKANLQTLLAEIQTTRVNLTANLDRSETLVEKLRTKLDKDIDDSFKDDQPDK